MHLAVPSNRGRWGRGLETRVWPGGEYGLLARGTSSHWLLQTEKELDPDGLKKESESRRAMLALTSTLSKLIRRLEEKQSPEMLRKPRRRKVVPRKPPPSPQPAGETGPMGRSRPAT